MMILSEDALKYIKKMYISDCIKTIIIFAGLYTVVKRMNEQSKQINNLTEKIREFDMKGE